MAGSLGGSAATDIFGTDTTNAGETTILGTIDYAPQIVVNGTFECPVFGGNGYLVKLPVLNVLNSTSTSNCATSDSVRRVYAYAQNLLPLTGGTLTGGLSTTGLYGSCITSLLTTNGDFTASSSSAVKALSDSKVNKQNAIIDGILTCDAFFGSCISDALSLGSAHTACSSLALKGLWERSQKGHILTVGNISNILWLGQIGWESGANHTESRVSGGTLGILNPSTGAFTTSGKFIISLRTNSGATFRIQINYRTILETNREIVSFPFVASIGDVLSIIPSTLPPSTWNYTFSLVHL